MKPLPNLPALCCVLLLGLLSWTPASSAQAGPTGVTAPTALPPDTVAPEADDTSAASSSDPEAEPDEDSVLPPSPARSGPPLGKVRQALRQLEHERASTTNLWPWLGVGVGLGSSVGSAAYGFFYAIDCDDNCATPNWVSLVVVAGAAVAALSMIWLVRTDEDIRELESRKYHLERDLERMSITSRGVPARAQAGQISVRF